MPAPPSFKTALGAAVKARREELGLTQEQLDLRTDLHQRWISNVETGKRNPSYASLRRLAAGLDLTASETAGPRRANRGRRSADQQARHRIHEPLNETAPVARAPQLDGSDCSHLPSGEPITKAAPARIEPEPRPGHERWFSHARRQA